MPGYARQPDDRDFWFAVPRFRNSILFSATLQAGCRPTAPGGLFRHIASIGIGVSSGFAGIGGGILTNIVMMLMGLPIHKSIGRAAAARVAVSVPATVAAALASHSSHAFEVGSIDLTIWACIAPAQSVAAWFGARLATYVSAEQLTRVFATALGATGLTMLYSTMS